MLEEFDKITEIKLNKKAKNNYIIRKIKSFFAIRIDMIEFFKSLMAINFYTNAKTQNVKYNEIKFKSKYYNIEIICTEVERLNNATNK